MGARTGAKDSGFAGTGEESPDQVCPEANAYPEFSQSVKPILTTARESGWGLAQQQKQASV
jgi:hypothetical protein